ncbi:MAG: hypothetical protein ABIM89_19180 [Mycobacteriales bacterium]
MKARKVAVASALGIVTAFATIVPAVADAGVVKLTYVEDFQGTSTDAGYDACLGYAGQIYEDRHGQYNLTLHTQGANTDALHVEGTVDARFVISPIAGEGTVYTGTYREHSAGNFKVIGGEDVPFPAASYMIQGSGTGDDGSTIRFTSGGHFVFDRKTGVVKRAPVFIDSCTVG